MLRHDAKYARVEEQPQEQVDVLVPHVSKLSGTRQKKRKWRASGFKPNVQFSLEILEDLRKVFNMQWWTYLDKYKFGVAANIWNTSSGAFL